MTKNNYRKLTTEERDRIYAIHAYAPLTYYPKIDDPLIELNLIQMWDNTDYAVEQNLDTPIFAKNGSISKEWYDCG